jgi:hypothetical protein
MAKYVQTNENGYIVGMTDEPLLAGLFGGSSKDYMEVSDEQAKAIEPLLKVLQKTGKGLHKSKLDSLR